MSNPLSYPNLLRMVASMDQRIKELERRRPAPIPGNLDDLDDVEVQYGSSVAAPADGDLLTWDAGTSTPFGGIWKPVAPPAGDLSVLETLGTHTQTGSFTDSSPFSYGENITVNAYSKQLVIITAQVTSADKMTDTDGDQYTLPWTLTAFDYTHDPGASNPVGATGAGRGGTSMNASGWAQALLWAMNPTDTDRSNVITYSVQVNDDSALASGLGADVEVRVDTVFSLIAP